MIEVRPMRAAERERVHALLREAYSPYEANMAPALYEIYVSLLLKTEEGQALVAVDGEELVGTARLYAPGTAPVPLPPTWAWVRAVAVSPEARGKGVGEALMTHCATIAGGATALSLHTMDFMPSAIRLYERLGYVRCPEHDLEVGKKAGFDPKETFTAIAYQRPL
jgi:GNAT superfamily N-acetyltransferase